MDSIVNDDIDSDLKQLREKSNILKTQDKVDLWRRLLIKSFTRLSVLVYASTLFVITMRIKLNILGGYMYKEIDNDDKKLTKDIQNKYLSLIQVLFREGISELSTIIQEHTERTLSNYDLKQKLNLVDLEQIFSTIQMQVNETLESNKRNKLAKILLKVDEDRQEENNELLHKMLIETVDLLETEELFVLIAQHIGNGFSLSMDELANYFTPNQLQSDNKKQISKEKQDNKLINISEVKVPLAKIIPIINGLIPRAVNGRTLSSDILRMLINAQKIQILGANIYEVFSQ